MSPSRPYLLNALYEWILDNRCTPYIAVNAQYEGVIVPTEYVQGGQIVLDINPAAVYKFAMGKEVLQFSASFAGVSRNLYIPIPAITAIYSKETGAGMVFPANEYDDAVKSDAVVAVAPVAAEGDDDQGGPGASGQGSTSKKPTLRIVK